MPVKSTIQLLVAVWVVSMGALLLRMLILRLHHEFPLFAISTGLSVVFGVASVRMGLAAPELVNLGLLGDTMDLFLTPSIAIELFRRDSGATERGAPFLSPLVMTIAGGLGVTLFLVSSPDDNSVSSAAALAFIADTMITFLVIGYILRRLRYGSRLVEDVNARWLKRLFAIQVITSGIRSMVELSIKPEYFDFVDIPFFSIGILATAICTFALRKSAASSANL